MTQQFSPIINPDAPASSLEAKQPTIDNGTARLDKSRYFSPEFMAREWEQLWTRAWLIAGVSSDLAHVGDFFTFDIGQESVLVVKTIDGINAFYNVCSHRGSRLVLAERGNKTRFVCPFHSWRFDHSGKLVATTDEDSFHADVLCQRTGLSAVACEERAGLVFVNMADDPPPLKDRYCLPDGYLEAYRIDRMKVVRHVRTEWAANWKLGVEAFYESYHLHAVHPETRWVMGDLNVQYDLYPNGGSRMIVPLGQPTPRMKDQKTVNDGLKAMLRDAGIDPATYTGTAREVRRDIQTSKRQRAETLGFDYSDFVDGQLSDSWATGLFPNVQIGCHPEGVFLMQFLPHPTNPERFFYDTMTLIHPADDPNYAAPAWMGIPEGTDLTGRTRPACEHFGVGESGNLGLVLEQDAELLPIVQKGMRSKGFAGELWGEQEQRLRHFHTELDRYLTGQK